MISGLPQVMLMALIGIGLALPIVDDQKIARAREELKEARADLDAAEEALKQVYLTLEEEFNRIAGPYADSYVKSLDRAFVGIYPEIKATLEKEGRPLHQVPRRRFTEVAAPKLEEVGLKALDIDSRLLQPFIKTGLAFLATKARSNTTLYIGELEMELATVLTPSVRMHTFWNEHLFMRIDEAKAFARANEEFAEVSITLDRLEHPENYTAKGEHAPPRMVYIPSGSYSIGPNTGWEKPRRRVTLREFYIDRYEITNKEYRDFLKSRPAELYEEYVPHFWPRNANMERFYPEDKAFYPVSGVSWRAAAAFAEWAGKRLPTEEEWEVAASGKRGLAFPWGNAFEAGRSNTDEADLNNTVEVGSYPQSASPFGCMDMAGNVWEWTSTDQDGGRVLSEDQGAKNVVIRGGDYKEAADHARCDFRWMAPMNPYAGRNPSKKIIGFRCVMKVE